MQEYGSSTLKDSLSDETNKLAARQAMIETLTSCSARALSPSHSSAYYADFYTEDTHTRTRTGRHTHFSLVFSQSFILLYCYSFSFLCELALSLSFSFSLILFSFLNSLSSLFNLIPHSLISYIFHFSYSFPFLTFTHSRYLSNEEK